MNYFSLYPNCTLTKGYGRTCLSDLERNLFCSIPNELYEVLSPKFNINIRKIGQEYSKEDFDIIYKYLLALKEEKFISFSEEEELSFRDIEPDSFYSPFELEDLLIDITTLNDFSLLSEKLTIDAENLQLRLFFNAQIRELEQILQNLTQKNFSNVEVIFNHHSGNDEKKYIWLFNQYPFVSRLVIMNFHTNTCLKSQDIICLEKPLMNHLQCGQIHEKLFSPNIRTYISSKKCNSCLHKKIAIDTNGNIKNCPSMAQSFGNIQNTTLEEALNHPDFKKYWNITKDQIAVCKDCEFRYICTDCRAYLENPEDQYSKPLKCGYNPYTNVWEEWSANPLKQKAMAYYKGTN